MTEVVPPGSVEPPVRGREDALAPEEYDDAWWGENANILHLYPQAAHHGPARIIATREALRGLAAALLTAADAGRAQFVTMTRDGEGYGVGVERTNSTGLGYTRLPYHPEWACSETDMDTIDRLRARIAELEGSAEGVAPLNADDASGRDQ